MMRVWAGKKRADRERKSESESERVGLVGWWVGGWGPRLSRSKGTKGGWTRGRGGSRGRWGCDGVASASSAGGGAGARRGALVRTLPIHS